MSPKSLLFALLGAPLAAWVVACAGWGAPSLPEVERLPPGGGLLVGGALDGGPTIYRWVVLAHDGRPAVAWRLRDGRGLTEGGSACIVPDEEVRWEADRGAVLFRGPLGCTTGTYRLARDGEVATVGLPTLPAEVVHPSWPLVGPGERVAVVGTTYPGGGPGTERLFVGRPGEAAAVIGAEAGFEDITFPRWAPDGRTLAFVGATRPESGYRRRPYVADVATGEVRLLADVEVLIEAAPVVLPDGAVVFAAASSAGAPAIFRAAPGGEAEPWVELASLPGIARWRGALVPSPDGRRVAFAHDRDHPTTPRTLYVVDLDAREVRDLLPTDLAATRTGEVAGAEPPSFDPLAWSPDGARLVFASDLGGTCRPFGPLRIIGCSDHLYEVPAAGGPVERLHPQGFASVRFAAWIP